MTVLPPRSTTLVFAADVGLHAGLIAHVDQPVALDRQCGCFGEVFIHSIDVAVAVYAVGGLCPAAIAGSMERSIVRVKSIARILPKRLRDMVVPPFIIFFLVFLVCA